MHEENLSSKTISNLDFQAKELGMGGKLSPETDEKLYKKNATKKRYSIKKIKNKENQKRIINCFYRNGKGKTTASLGMALRTIGHGYKVAIIQFIKGGWTTGEEKAFKSLSSNFHGIPWEKDLLGKRKIE